MKIEQYRDDSGHFHLVFVTQNPSEDAEALKYFDGYGAEHHIVQVHRPGAQLVAIKNLDGTFRTTVFT